MPSPKAESTASPGFLACLGGPDLQAIPGDSSRILQRPKLTALLVYLACARKYLSKHILLGMFWPELDEERARAALRKAVFLLRQDLGEAAVRARGSSELFLNPDCLRCDATDFVDALRAGEPRRALDLYKGEFLPGFYVRRAPDFEDWADGQRATLRSAAEQAALRLGQSSLRSGQPEEALLWARRGREISPASEEPVILKMSALHAANGAPAALDAFARFARQLRAAYGMEPSARLRDLARSMGADRGPHTTSVPVTVGSTPTYSGDLHRELIESAEDVIYRVDPQGFFTYLNPSGMRRLDPSRSARPHLLDLVRPDFHERVFSALSRQLADGVQTTYSEIPVVGDPGADHWLGQIVQLVKLPDGTVAGFQGIGRNISPNVRMAKLQTGLALRDRVTDLYTPLGFYAMAEDRLKIALRGDNQLILACFDPVENTGSGAAENAVTVARLLEGTFRASDVLARLSERRYAVLVLEAKHRTAEEWLESTMRRLRKTAESRGLSRSLVVNVEMLFSGTARHCDAQMLLEIGVSSGPATRPLLPF